MLSYYAADLSSELRRKMKCGELEVLLLEVILINHLQLKILFYFLNILGSIKAEQISLKTIGDHREGVWGHLWSKIKTHKTKVNN